MLALLLTLSVAAQAVSTDSLQQRKRVAVVLSGGGALGAIHVGALHVIEQAGIPVDMVVGTSMGSIVGALYSVGYDSDDIACFKKHGIIMDGLLGVEFFKATKGMIDFQNQTVKFP